ncbi:MAG: glycogen/starch/alpha-glucan phosphorylase, partial [Negativicutes bacterium]|nr:glycogen/starch/alpha-glucan phosphorylase [Negativicutes bacterium]
FKQGIEFGYQVEYPDNWLAYGSPWEVLREELTYRVKFGGTVELYHDASGKLRFNWKSTDDVLAVAYDIPIPGYKNHTVNNLRLWQARATEDFDFHSFNEGDYLGAVERKSEAETISKVLYPNDNTVAGRALRLKQQYFFVSAGLQSIVRRYKNAGYDIRQFDKYTVIHINDTHPALAVPELMRILTVDEGLGWGEAWQICTRTFAYTNHTIMEEALERWPVKLFAKILPHIHAIVNEINERFCDSLWSKFPGEWQKVGQMAIIAHDEVKMANLAIVGSFSVNGVSTLHTDILKQHTFSNFYQLYPDKFRAITNGITHRRFLIKANPGLTELLNEKLGKGWYADTAQLSGFAKYADCVETQAALRAIRLANKERMARYILHNNGVTVDPHSIFDVQIKRLHEYKRQLLNVLHIMHLYNRLREHPGMPIHPRTFIFGAKAAPSYHMAKRIIRLINAVADKVNNDKSINDKLKVVFLENYRVSVAEKIIPAADVSEQISTAGKEASGTGNMKFMMNGALTVGTLDGANVEMLQAVGEENIFIFGLKAEEVHRLQHSGSYRPWDDYENNQDLSQVIDQLHNGFFDDVAERGAFEPIYRSLMQGMGAQPDPYFVLRDFAAYAKIQEEVDREYKNPRLWWRKAILNIAASGVFSSDRTIREYNEQIWQLPQHWFDRGGTATSDTSHVGW